MSSFAKKLIGIGFCCLTITSGSAHATEDPWRRDPFVLPLPQGRDLSSELPWKKCPGSLQLEGIIQGDVGSQAFLNGNIYGKHQSVLGHQIIKITGESVVFRTPKYFCSLAMKLGG